MILAACSLSGFALAEEVQKQPDQSYVLEGTPGVVAIPTQLKGSNQTKPPTGLKQVDIKALLEGLLSGSEGGIKPDVYYVLHLVRYTKGEPASADGSWYAYFAGWDAPTQREKMNDPELPDHFKQARLFGAKKLSFVYLHYGIPIGTVTTKIVQEAIETQLKKSIPDQQATTPGQKAPTENVERLKIFWEQFEAAYKAGTLVDGAVTAKVTPGKITTETYSAYRTQTETAITQISSTLAPRWSRQFEQGLNSWNSKVLEVKS